jgi:hypothetical protein
VLSGEVHPASPHRRAWHAMLVAVCAAALDRGFLPHTNAGRAAGQARRLSIPPGAGIPLICDAHGTKPS